MNNDKPYSGTQSVLRAISLLKVFSDSRPEWSLGDLTRELEFNKTTTYRLLTALESEGMVSRDHESGAFRLGPEIIAMGGRALRANDLRSVAHTELDALAQMVGEAATLEILMDGQTLILEEVVSNHVVASWQSVGTRYPAHATSTGKVLLAFLPQSESQAALKLPLKRLAENTIADLDQLNRELKSVLENGYAVANEELEPGFVAVSAPVRDHDGRVVAAISVGGPSNRLTDERLVELPGLVIQTADRISSKLGFRQ